MFLFFWPQQNIHSSLLESFISSWRVKCEHFKVLEWPEMILTLDTLWYEPCSVGDTFLKMSPRLGGFCSLCDEQQVNPYVVPFFFCSCFFEDEFACWMNANNWEQPRLGRWRPAWRAHAENVVLTSISRWTNTGPTSSWSTCIAYSPSQVVENHLQTFPAPGIFYIFFSPASMHIHDGRSDGPPSLFSLHSSPAYSHSLTCLSGGFNLHCLLLRAGAASMCLDLTARDRYRWPVAVPARELRRT